jgi:RNA-directed DNA polymerase
MIAKLHAIKGQLRSKMHDPIPEVGKWLKRVVDGYYRYHSVPGNLRRMRLFRNRLCRLWLQSTPQTDMGETGSAVRPVAA